MTFETLSDTDKLAAFTSAAEAALTHWRIPHARLELLSLRSNAVFAATYPEHPDDFQMVLRVNWPGRKSTRMVRCETIWLDILAKQWLPVPKVIRSATEITIDGTPFPCSLFEYQPGNSIPGQDFTEAQARAVGTFAAALHSIETGIQPGGAFLRPRLDSEGLFGADSPYAPGPDGDALLQPHASVMEQVIARVDAVFAVLQDMGSEYGLIHGDLKPDNLLFDNGELRVLDFDDCGWGYFLYDLAPFLLFIKEHANYAQLKQALWDGYIEARPLPETLFDSLETLVAGRYVASCRWVAAHRDHPAYRGKVEGILADRAARLARFLDSGVL